MEESIKEIVMIEWRMLDTVKNIGGRAACQNDFTNFNIARSAEFEAWNKEARTSYYNDLVSADKEGRNLYTERYAYMMEYSSPLEYEQIKHLLPQVSEDKLYIINKICKIQLKWAAQLEEKYPYVGTQTRPLYGAQDNPECVSVESFMKGTLKTYSPHTLKLYLSHIEKIESIGESIAEIITTNTMKKYGFKSLKEANERIKQNMSFG